MHKELLMPGTGKRTCIAQVTRPITPIQMPSISLPVLTMAISKSFFLFSICSKVRLIIELKQRKEQKERGKEMN
jgi:hypothetical protein